ncbi:hypothetical protein ACFLUS_04995 [Chloroflexota bacterium]
MIDTLEKARSMGADFRITDEGRVLVRGLSLLPTELREVLRQHKAELRDYLKAQGNVPPIIWETGNISQIRSLLVLREAELLLANAQLTGDDYGDWYVRNRIRDLEIKIADLKRWLAEANKDKGNRD